MPGAQRVYYYTGHKQQGAWSTKGILLYRTQGAGCLEHKGYITLQDTKSRVPGAQMIYYSTGHKEQGGWSTKGILLYRTQRAGCLEHK